VPAFTCYRLHDTLHGGVPENLDEYIDIEDQAPTIYGPASHGDFVAKLYVSVGPPHPPGWAGFVRDGFIEAAESGFEAGQEALELLRLPVTSSVGAAIVLKLIPEGHVFAFTFGITGRFLLKHEAWQRGYGLQTALNLIYPRVGAGGGTGRLVAVDAKRRAGEFIRSRQQASRATTFEAFDVDKIRDLVGGATGEPYDHRWGRRISGTDQLSFAADSEFAGLGKLCRDLDEAHNRDDYKERFAWLDSIRPIHDPELLSQIQDHLVGELLTGPLSDLDLAPPEIIDWSQVIGFRYHYDARKSFTRPDMQLTVYRDNLFYYEDDLESIDVDYLRRKSIRALDADGREVHRWSVWRCLTGEFQFNGITYVIDEGEIFEVSPDYLASLNGNLSRLPLREDLAWPEATTATKEDAFNDAAAKALAPALLMDKKLVNSRMQTTPVEICDVLTASHQLIHAKLKLGSRDLSHLFSQGFVSATLLQSDSVFREATHKKIKELGGGTDFDFFEVTSLQASQFEIIYVIVAPWRGRSLAEAMPFFSKINLLRTAEELVNRGFQVALVRINTGPTPKKGQKAHQATSSTA
jgi:uncharacterized protein (TIGR04141 family)